MLGPPDPPSVLVPSPSTGAVRRGVVPPSSVFRELLSLHLCGWSSSTVVWAPEGPGPSAQDILLQQSKGQGCVSAFQPRQQPLSIWEPLAGGIPGWTGTNASLSPCSRGTFWAHFTDGEMEAWVGWVAQGIRSGSSGAGLESQCVHLRTQRASPYLPCHPGLLLRPCRRPPGARGRPQACWLA